MRVAPHGLVEPRGSQPAPPRRSESGRACRLHPDDVGTELREVARRDRRRDAIAELEDPDTLERQSHLAGIVHARGTLLSRRVSSREVRA